MSIQAPVITVANPSGSTADEMATGGALSIPRRPLAVILTLVSVALPWLGLGGIWSAGAMLMLGALLALGIVPDRDKSTNRLTLVEWLPAGVLIVLLAVTVLGMVSALSGAPFWQERTTALAVWSALTAGLAAFAARRPGRVTLAPGRATLLITGIPFVALSAVLLQPFEVWARVVNRGTDFSRHAIMVLDGTRSGWLDYSSNGYPRSAHAALSLVESATGGTTYTSAWQATQGLLFWLLALMALAASMLAWRVSTNINPASRRAPIVAGSLTMAAMFLGPWVADMLYSGFITSFEAGAILGAVALLYFDGRDNPTLACALSQVALVALMAHTWILLVPLVGLPALRIVVPLMRSGRFVPLVAASGLAALVMAPVAVASVLIVGIGHASTAGGTTLPEPGVTWMVLLITAGVGVSVLRRSGRPLQSQALMLLIVGLVGTLVLLLPFSKRGDQAYYLTKTVWTPYGVLVALAVPTVIWLFLRSQRRTRIALGLILALAAVLALPPALRGSMAELRGNAGVPALVIPLVEQIDQRYAESAEKPEILVWGLMPYLEGDEVSVRRSGRIDNIARGALYVGGYPISDATVNYDPALNCQYLSQRPDVLLVTGPYPDGPLQWLAEGSSQCPPRALDPANWLSIDVDPAWFDGTSHEDVPFGQDYASWSKSFHVID